MRPAAVPDAWAMKVTFTLVRLTIEFAEVVPITPDAVWLVFVIWYIEVFYNHALLVENTNPPCV